MNESIRPINPSSENIQPQSTPSSASIRGVLSNGRKVQAPSFDSNLAEPLDKSAQIAQNHFKTNQDLSNQEDIIQTLIQASLFHSEYDDLSGEEAEEPYEVENKELDIQQEGVFEQQEGVFEQQEGIAEKENIVVKTEDSIKEVKRKSTKTEALRNRVVTSNTTDTIHKRFMGDLGVGFALKKNPGQEPLIRETAENLTEEYEKEHKKRGLKPIDRKLIYDDAMRAVGLRFNAIDDMEFTQEDAEKVGEKFVKLLRHDMKDKQGNVIDDEKFYIIQEEVKKNFSNHLIFLGMIKPSEVVKQSETDTKKTSEPTKHDGSLREKSRVQRTDSKTAQVRVPYA